MASKPQSWKDLTRHQAPKSAFISHASCKRSKSRSKSASTSTKTNSITNYRTVSGESFTNYERVVPSIYNLPLDSESNFNPLRGEFTCDKHYFLLISVHRLSSIDSDANYKIFLEFTNESIAGPKFSCRFDINELFGDYRHCLEEENSKFNIMNHEEYSMTKNFIAKVMQQDQIPKRKPKMALGRIRKLVPRANNKSRVTKAQWREFNRKDGIFTRYYDINTWRAFCADRQRIYDEAKAEAEKINSEDDHNAGPNAFARMFKVLKGTKIRLVLESNKNEENNTNDANNTIKLNNSVILWSLAVVQEAYFSDNDVLKMKLKNSFVNHNQPYCCFKCGKRVETASGFVQHFKTHAVENPASLSQKKSKNIPCTVNGCTKQFSNEEGMKQHVKFYRHAKCPTCHKRVKNESALQTHNYIKHGRYRYENPHIYIARRRHYYIHYRVGKVCNICREPFPQPDDKLRHMNDYKHYQCQICFKSFMTEGNLQRHVRCKHPIYYQERLHEAPNKKAKRLAHMTNKANVDEESYH